MSIREEILEEHKKNWKEMTPEQRLKHFWHYYKIHVAVAAVIKAIITAATVSYTHLTLPTMAVV